MSDNGSCALPRWTKQFLRLLKRTGSVTGAAKKSGVCPTAPYIHRRADPTFAAAWDAALHPHREKAPAWEARFLRFLAEDGNASNAAKRAGVSLGAPQGRRLANAGFAAAWTKTLEPHRQGEGIVSVEAAAQQFKCSRQTLHRLARKESFELVPFVETDSIGREHRRTGINKSELSALFVKRPRLGEPIRLHDGTLTDWYLREDFYAKFKVTSGFMLTHAGDEQSKLSILHPGPRLRHRTFYVISERQRGRPKQLTAWSGNDAENILAGKESGQPEKGRSYFARGKRTRDEEKAEAFCRQLKRSLPMRAADVVKLAREQGVSLYRLYRARKEASIQTSQPDLGKAGRCGWWLLTGQTVPADDTAPPANSTASEERGRRVADADRKNARNMPSAANDNGKAPSPAADARIKPDDDPTDYFVHDRRNGTKLDKLVMLFEELTKSQTAFRFPAAEQTPLEPGNEAASQELPTHLATWRDILFAIGLKNTPDKQKQVGRLNKDFDGPIIPGKQGGQPFVEKGKLLNWIRGLEEQVRARHQEDANKEAELQERHAYGKNGTVLPEIGGHVKKRRARPGRNPTSETSENIL